MEMMAYKFEDRIHYVCMTCNNTDTAQEYIHEVHTTNQKHLITLNQDRDELQRRVAELERNESVLRNSLRALQAEIASYKDMETGYSTQIAGLVQKIENGEIARTMVEDQVNRRALRQVEGKMYGKLPPAGERTLAFAMLVQPRLGNMERCLAKSLAGQTDVLQMIYNMCLTKSTLDVQNDNCQTLTTMLQTLLQKDPSTIIEKINIVLYNKSTIRTAEQGVLCNINAIGVLDVDVGQTLQHVLFSREFQNRDFEERRRISVPGCGRLRTLPPMPTRINSYVSGMVETIHNFSAGLLAIDMPAGSCGLLCVMVNQFCDHDDSCGELVVPTITQGGSLTTPAVSVSIAPEYEICKISLYNLGDRDLFFSGNPFAKSAQLHTGDFVIRRGTDGVVPKHDSNAVPARGFVYLETIYIDAEETTPEFHLQDVNGKVVVTFALQFGQ